MSMTTVSSLNRSVQKTQVWLKTLVEQGHLEDESQAYSALRSVLHALRDRLTVDEAAHLSAQLPLVVRGIYFEGWKPAATPARYDQPSELFDRVRRGMNDAAGLDPAHATRAVFALLAQHVTPGEIRDVVRMLPEDLRALWPEAVQAQAH